MRIVHVVRSLDASAGGLPVVPVRMAAAQANLGHKTWVLTQNDAASLAEVPEVLRDVRGSDQIGRLTIRPAGPAAMLGIGRAWRDLKHHLAQADAVHIHGVWDPILWVAATTAQSLNIPYLLAAHGMLDPWCLAQKRWKKKAAMALGWRSILNRAAALHLLNEDERRLVIQIGLTAPTEIIPIGVPLQDIDSGKRETFAARYPKIGNRPYILFVSRLHFKKGLDFLADAFRTVAERHPEVQLVIVGPDDGARADFEERIRAGGISHRVHVLGALSTQDKWDALAGATCFCLPSRQEGFSMAILEALAARVPAVITEACHFPEVAEIGAGEVTALDAAAVASALDRVLADADRRARMGAAGRRMVEERFTWPRVAEISIRAYERARKR